MYINVSLHGLNGFMASGVSHQHLTVSPVLNLGPVCIRYVVDKVALG